MFKEFAAFHMDEISVLVCYGERRRPLKTSSSFLALKEAVLAEFTDIFPVERDRCELLFQRKDDSWGGVFVDIVEEEPIPDRSVVKVSVLYSQHITEDTSSSQQPTEQVCMPLTFCYEKKHHEYSFHFFNQGVSEHTTYVTEEVLMVQTKGAARQCQLTPTLGLAIRDPSMLTQKKGKLLEAAKDEVYACGYNFKKSHSRSKRFSSDSSSSSTPKRKNLNKEFREDRIHNIKEEIHDLNSRICFKEKRVLAAANMKNYNICDEVSGEISELKTKRRELETELKELQRKDNRAQKYQMK